MDACLKTALRIHENVLKQDDNNSICYEIVPAQKPQSGKGQSGTESLADVPGSDP